MQENYLQLRSQIDDIINHRPGTIAEWMQMQPYVVYKRLHEFLGITRGALSQIANNRQHVNAEVVKRMAVISTQPAMQIVDDMQLLDFSLREINELREFDNQHKTLFYEDNGKDASDEKRAASE